MEQLDINNKFLTTWIHAEGLEYEPNIDLM